MPQFNYQTGQMEETDEERQAREEAEKRAGTTVVGETKVKQYQDGSQTETITKKVPAPSFIDRMGQAVQQAGTNFVNNVAAAPERFAQNVQAIPGQIDQRVMNIANQMAPQRPAAGFQGQTDEFGGVDAAIARQAQQPAQQPAPVAPVAPGSTFDRMIQVESGGRQTDAQGRVLTSDKGAMGIAQVMPATAMDPGYGVKNIFDLAQERGIPFQNRDRATAEQLLGNRALNQEFGANYYAAMNQRFDGGPGAVAAYNAGPGRVAQNMARNQGQLNVAQLPQETQGYLQKVGMPAAGQPPAQAASTFQGQTNEFGGMEEIPKSQPVSPYSLATGVAQQGLGTPQQRMAPAPVDTTQSVIDRYQSIQDKPDELMKFAFDAATPDYLKQRAKDQIVEGYDRQKKEAEATKILPTLGPNELARAMTKKSEGNSVGDWMQYLLFRHVGLTDLANQKGEQLGIGHKWTQSTITDEAGTDIAVELQTTASGKVLGGNRLDGTPLTAKELGVAGGTLGGGKFKPEIGGAYVKKDANGNVIARGVRTTQVVGNKTVTKVESGGKTFDINAGWEPEGITTAAQKAENAAAVKLRYAGPTSYTEAGAKAAGEFNFQNGTNIGYATQAPGAPLVDLTTGKPVQVSAGGVISVTQTGTPGAAPAAEPSPADITMGKKVTQEEQVKFIESKKAIGESSQGGLEIGNARRQQLELIKQNPSILNIMNGSGTQYDQARNLIVRMASGAYSDDNKEALYKDIKALGFGPGETGALQDFANLNTGINAKTLKANSGAGAISNAEQQANKDANIGNVDRITAYAAMSGLHRSQFAGDLAASKQMFLSKRPDLKTDAQFNSAWQKEEANLLKGYQGIARARFEVMGKPPEANASKEAMAAYKDRVFRAFEAYPAPQFDSASGTWNYQTANAKRAAMKQIVGQ